MRAVGLPARIIYATVTLVVGGGIMFYFGVRLLPELLRFYPDLAPGLDGYGSFKLALCVAVGIAFTLALYQLTLPGIRRRKRRGRAMRTTLASVMVVLLSLTFAGMGFGWIYDLLFAAWLTYTFAFTFVRYGVLDDGRRSSRAANEY